MYQITNGSHRHSENFLTSVLAIESVPKCICLAFSEFVQYFTQTVYTWAELDMIIVSYFIKECPIQI